MPEKVNLPRETTMQRVAASLETMAANSEPSPEEFVRFNRLQNLTEQEQQQARDNIGAVSKKVLTGSLSSANTTDFDSISFSLKKQNGFCVLNCVARARQELTGNKILGTIPAEFRPSAKENGVAFVVSTQNLASLYINADGTVEISIGATIQSQKWVTMLATWIVG